MKSPINIFYFDSKGFSTLYGIGSYRKVLLPELAKSGVINLTHVRFSYRDQGGVDYRQSDSTQDYNTLDIIFSLKDFTQYQIEENYIDHFRARICITMILQITGLREGIFHLNSSSDQVIAKYAKAAGYKVMGTQHVPFSIAHTTFHFYQEYLDWSLEKEKKHLAELDGMICLCPQALRDIHTISPTTFSKIIYNGVSTTRISKKVSRSEGKATLGFSQDDFIFLFSSRLDRLKGLYELIDAFTAFANEKRNVKLIIAGGGDYDTALKRAQGALGKIIFTGFLDHQKLIKLLEIADVGLLPSHSEQSSFSTLEMLSHGIPMIVTDSSGFEVFKDGRDVIKVTGERLPSGDLTSVHIDSIKDALEVVYKDASLRQRLGKQGKRLVNTIFSTKLMAESTIEFYQTLATS